ncbi:HTH_Tnp_Tc3_2 domain-containing protein [Trichonephila clavipes]|nr:HTH_Tnp_Tc3_2 domain-containing protein [Trichonephila clavipes]
MWSDESRYTFFCNGGTHRILRESHEALNPSGLTITLQKTGCSIITWDIFFWHESGVSCRSSIQHLLNWPSIGDNTSRNILHLFQHLSDWHPIHLQGVPSHVGLLGNEVADDCAMAATSDPVDPEYHMVLTSTEIYSRAKELICRTWVVPPHVSGFDKGRIVAYRNRGLSCHNIASRVGRDPVTVRRIWNQWVQNGNTERRAESQRPPIISCREDRHVTRMALMDRAAISRALNQVLGSFVRQVSAQIVRRRLQQHRLTARRPWMRVLLTLCYRQNHFQWWNQRRTWVHGL